MLHSKKTIWRLNPPGSGSTRFLAAAGFLCLLLLSKFPLHAQSTSRWHSGITLTAGLAAKNDIKGNKALYDVKSAPQPCFEGTFNVYAPIARNYWLTFGLGGGVAGYNFDYYIRKEAFNPPLAYDVFDNGASSRNMDLVYLRLPVELERRWTASNGNVWNANAGISLLYAPPADATSESVVQYSNSEYRYLVRNQHNDNDGNPWLNYQVAGGYAWKLRHGHLIRANAKVSFSFTDFASGTYRFTLPQDPVAEGSYSISGSYIGLSVSYIFAK